VLDSVATTHTVFTDALTFIHNNWLVFVSGHLAANIISSAIRSLPKPEPFGNKFYLWFYLTVQGVYANYDKNSSATKSQAIVENATDRAVAQIVQQADEPRKS
jgi:hypothetical protein